MQSALRGQLIRAGTVAEIIGVSRRMANELMRQMPRINIGSSQTNPRWAVYEADLNAWLESRKEPTTQDNKKRVTPKPSTTGLDENGHILKRR